MRKKRQQAKKQEIREAILDAARQIICEQGFLGLSIRKITNAINYSPGIVYHYFKNKDEIVKTLVEEGYQQILASVSSVTPNETAPEEEVREAFKKYIRASVSAPEEYKAFMLNDEPTVCEKTCVLRRGVGKQSRTLRYLIANLERGIEQGRYEKRDTELTAQILWASTFGLITKLLFEPDISQEQIDRLIDHHFAILFYGVKKRTEGAV